ncbi:MAG: metallophosphoesterase [Ignavibacteriota bacterium]
MQININNNTAFASIDTNAFKTNQILSCPTDNSITIRIVPKQIFEIYFEYGTTTSYGTVTNTVTSTANVPVQFLLNNLTPNTRYYYRLRYRLVGAQTFIIGDQFTFMTQRPRGSTFVFTINGDSHLYDKKGAPSMMRVTNTNVKKDNPDFHFELGDTYGDDRTPANITQQSEMMLKYNFLPFIGMIAPSSSYYFVMGNHEGENAWYITQPQNLYLWGTLARKYYYANPEPNGFYSGDTTIEGSGMGRPQNYYSWEWGDALFVVLDDYRYCTTDASPGQWNWTIGLQQYNWFKQTLQNSNAKYKFVFAHHALGYGRGGISQAVLYEWGDAANFNTNRPGWGGIPIHQLMVQNHVSVFFQGHDHLFATEQLNGLVYQEVGMPSDSTYQIGILANASAYTGNNIYDGSGHIRVTVSPVNARVDYVSAYLPADTNATHHNDSVRFSYTVNPYITSLSGQETQMPGVIELEQNFPNPFNPSTEIKYKIAEAGIVILKVYDVQGKEITTLVDEYQQPGAYVANFSAQQIPSGIYYYQLRLNNSTIITKKAILVK